MDGQSISPRINIRLEPGYERLDDFTSTLRPSHCGLSDCSNHGCSSQDTASSQRDLLLRIPEGGFVLNRHTHEALCGPVIQW